MTELSKFLEWLPLRDQQILMCLYVEGLDPADVAELFRVNQSWVIFLSDCAKKVTNSVDVTYTVS